MSRSAPRPPACRDGCGRDRDSASDHEVETFRLFANQRKLTCEAQLEHALQKMIERWRTSPEKTLERWRTSPPSADGGCCECGDRDSGASEDSDSRDDSGSDSRDDSGSGAGDGCDCDLDCSALGPRCREAASARRRRPLAAAEPEPERKPRVVAFVAADQSADALALRGLADETRVVRAPPLAPRGMGDVQLLWSLFSSLARGELAGQHVVVASRSRIARLAAAGLRDMCPESAPAAVTTYPP